MRTHRFAIAGVALLASATVISCGSDDNDAPANTGTPVVIDDTTVDTLPIADTTIDITDSTVEVPDATLDEDSPDSTVDDDSTESSVEEAIQTTLP